MNIRLLRVLAGLAISFALLAFAQQKDTVDPQTAQEIRALAMHYEEAYNEHDAAAVAALFAEDAVWRTPQGTFHGRQAIERRLAEYHFQRWHSKNEVINVDRVIAVGHDVRAIGTWSNTVQASDGSAKDLAGHFISVLVREADTWRIRMNTYDQSRSY